MMVRVRISAEGPFSCDLTPSKNFPPCKRYNLSGGVWEKRPNSRSRPAPCLARCLPGSDWTTCATSGFGPDPIQWTVTAAPAERLIAETYERADSHREEQRAALAEMVGDYCASGEPMMGMTLIESRESTARQQRSLPRAAARQTKMTSMRRSNFSMVIPRTCLTVQCEKRTTIGSRTRAEWSISTAQVPHGRHFRKNFERGRLLCG